MAVLIKGMEMPESCDECNFGYDGKCFAVRPSRWMETDDCPLAEVPDDDMR